MDNKSTWPEGSPETGVHYFRAGEVIALVAPPKGEDTPPARAGLRKFLQIAFDRAGFPLERSSFRRRRDQKLLPIPRVGEPLYLQTVTLVDTPPTHTHDTRLITPALRRVVDAVDKINPPEQRGRVPKEDYEIVAITPNWLAMSFHL